MVHGTDPRLPSRERDSVPAFHGRAWNEAEWAGDTPSQYDSLPGGEPANERYAVCAGRLSG